MAINNPTTVHRIWSDGSSDLIAIFEYETQAIQFANAENSVRDTPYTLAIYEHYAMKLTFVKKNEPLRQEPRP